MQRLQKKIDEGERQSTNTWIVPSWSNLHWLSFCDTSAPAGEQFLGVCIVPASHFIEAVAKAHALGINPGGQVAGYELEGETALHESWIGVLLSREEAEGLINDDRGARPRK